MIVFDPNPRPTREILHMITASLWAQRSLCCQPIPDEQKKHGAVITTSDYRRILSIGYNGPGRGLPHNYCATSKPAGSSRCGCLHAEDNAIAFVDSTIPDKVLFVTMMPCITCAQRIVNANISKVFYSRTYRDPSGVELLREQGVEVVHLPIPEKIL